MVLKMEANTNTFRVNANILTQSESEILEHGGVYPEEDGEKLMLIHSPLLLL